jgi:hypothetical protein
MAVDDGYTIVLLHLNGADASTTFTDESGKTWSAVNNAQIDTAQSKFGNGSLLCDGTGDYITTPDHADFVLGSGSWTMDCWLRLNADEDSLLFGQFEDANNEFQIFYSQTNSKIFCYQYEGGAFIWYFECAWNPSTATWYHLAVVRDGNNTPLIFINGTSQSVTENTAISGKTAADLAGLAYIGGKAAGNDLNGWIDEMRFSKGIARWTANFSPPAEPYGIIRGTPIFW